MAHNNTQAYTAGIIDGEGCVRIAKILKKNPLHSTQYLLRVSVKMTNYDVLLWLKQTWGGNIYKKKLISGRKQQWDWVIQAKLARTLLTEIMPYLIVKHSQAEVALSLQMQQTSKKIPPEAQLIRESLFLKMKRLNLRGTS